MNCLWKFVPLKYKALAKRILARWEMLPYLQIHPVDNLILVTGANSKYFNSLLQFLNCYYQYEDGPIIVYDLGLSQAEQISIKTQFPGIELRVFDYTKYPPFFDIKIAAGEYAWKPAIIYEVLLESKGCVCWMDSANILCSDLKDIRKILAKKGFYSPYSSDSIAKWTHQGTLDYLGYRNNLTQRNLAGTCVALNYDYPSVRQLAERWKECSLDKKCIAPDGSSRKNHRQDQAVLSVLAYQLNLVKGYPHYYHGFDVHHKVQEN